MCHALRHAGLSVCSLSLDEAEAMVAGMLLDLEAALQVYIYTYVYRYMYICMYVCMYLCMYM